MDPWNPNGWDKFLRRSKQATILASVSVLVGFTAGSWLGVAVAEGRDPQTVTVTKEVPGPTKTVTKTKTETVTKIETRLLPDSCETVIDMASVINDSASQVNRDGTKVKLRMEQVTGDILRDPSSVNDAEVDLAKLKIKLDDDLLASLENNERMAYRLQLCRDDIEASNDGDNVDPLDGEPGTLP